ncbi:MAG: HPF/RaiA family ribosome-associated protein [Candidatus Marsarchaeota archaeon]|nr:HPF/RaiA family ribosome-associated protein [Candidatus Marsarchaeota archaeon]
MDSDLAQRINITGDKTVYSQSIKEKISSEVGKVKSIEIESVNLHVKVNNHSKKEVYEIETSVILKKGGRVFAKTISREPNLALNENLKEIQKELMKKKKNPMHDYQKEGD